MSRLESLFQTLVDAYYTELYHFALGMSHSPDLAEDLVQETFARAWCALHKLKDEQAARAWLYTIIKREHARLYARQRPEIWQPDMLPAISVEGTDHSTEAFVLHIALSKLSSKYLEPLLLQVLGGFSCAEIGQILGLGDNAVMTRLFRARRKLRSMLGTDHVRTVAL